MGAISRSFGYCSLLVCGTISEELFISNRELALFKGDLGESVWADSFECHDLKCIAALSIVVNDHGGEL